jgi:peroxiredoxin
MNIRQRPIAYLIILGLGLLWMYLSMDKTGGSSTATTVAPQKGFSAPDFELKAIDGQTVRLSDLHGQAVLINLWATWCPPCREEMQTIDKVYKEYKDQGLQVLAINMTYQDDPRKIEYFVAEQNLTFPILLDDVGDMANNYQMRSLPSSFFIRRDGVINEVVIGGPMPEALLRTRIENILK